MSVLESPVEAIGDLFATEVAGYSILQLTVGAFAVAAVIGGARWAFNKALEKI